MMAWICLTVLLAAVIFAADILTPFDLAGGVPYVAVVLLSLKVRLRRFTPGVALGCAVLTLLGLYVTSNPGSAAEFWIALTNRGLGVFAIGATAMLGHACQRGENRLALLNRTLESRVQRQTAEVRRANASLQEEITRHRRAEERFRVAIESSADGMLIVDRRGKIVLVNQQVEELFGYTRDELVGRTLEILIPERFRERHVAQRDAFFAAPEMKRLGVIGCILGRRKDGSEFSMEIGLSPIESEGKLLVLATLRDVTEQNRRAEALRQNEARLRVLAEQAPAVLWTTDERLRFTSSLGAGLADLNLKPNEVVGTSLEEYFGTDDPDFPPIAAARRALSGESAGFDLEWAGRTYHTHMEALYDEHGRPVGTVGVAMDTSELKEAREQIERLNQSLEQRVAQRTRELTRANEALEAFCYSVSHDFRAPLRSLDGFSLMLLERCANKLDEEDRAHVRHIRATCRRMGHLIDALLMLFRVSRGPFARTKLDLTAMAGKIAAELQSGRPQRDVDFLIEDVPPAEGNERLVRLLLENLFDNAWKFTEKTAHGRIRFGSEKRGTAVAYFVSDNGAGFDMAYADKLFAPFERLHGQCEFDGMGIGLATVERIVHRHGGRVWAHGEVGRGATFYFTL